MKTITIDFDTYNAELAHEIVMGHRKGFAKALRIIEEFQAGSSEERLLADYCDDETEQKLIKTLFGGRK